MSVSQDDIDAAALRPAEITGEEGSVKERPIAELREAQKNSDANTAAAKRHRGFRFSQVEHGGSR